MAHLDGWKTSLASRESTTARQALPAAPTICQPLPHFATLENSAKTRSKEALRQHLIDEAVNSPLTLPEDAFAPPQSADAPPSTTTTATNDSTASRLPKTGKRKQGGGNYESFQVLRAIEKKDTMLLMDIRNQNFDLLITGSPLPIVYATRLGKTHHEMAILLVGAMSRKVNDTTDDELAMMDPATKATLRALRASLKIAITASIAREDTSLIASFLQVVIMSEGDRWLISTSQTLSLAFRTGRSSKPISTAESIMLKWVSRELQSEQVASVGEYVSNGVWDLTLLGLWSIVLDQNSKIEPIPLYYFARDDRILKAVEERISLLRQRNEYLRLSKPLRQQLETAVDILGRRMVGGRERIELLKEALDE